MAVNRGHCTPNRRRDCREWPAGKADSEIRHLIQENSKPQDVIVYADGSVTKDQSGWGSDSLAGTATSTGGFSLGRFQALRSLRHDLWAQSQGHHTIDRPEERDVERGRGQRSSLRGRKRAIVNQTNIGIVSKASRWELQSNRMERMWAFPSAWITS